MWRFWRVIFSDGITDGFKKTARTTTIVYIADGITDGFEMANLYGDVSIVLSEASTVSPTECPSVRVNICPICWPSPPLILLLLLNPNSPHLQTTSPPSPPNKNLPHISTTSYISWSFVVTASVFWFTDGFYQFL